MDQAGEQFELVRREPDPVRRARLASELITIYQQRSVELARLRREAINEAADERGLSFAAIASELGLTRGRITQIRQTAPEPERAFFGVGPVTVAVPLRQLEGRATPVISAEDARAAEMVGTLLAALAFQVQNTRIPVGGIWQPRADVVAICGPKSSPVTAAAIEHDPYLSFGPDDNGTWAIRERETGRVFESPMDQADPDAQRDVAYVGRLPIDRTDETILVVAGVHALGSVGAIDYIARHLADLYRTVGTRRFSMVIASTHDGESVKESEALWPATVHP